MYIYIYIYIHTHTYTFVPFFVTEYQGVLKTMRRLVAHGRWKTCTEKGEAQGSGEMPIGHWATVTWLGWRESLQEAPVDLPLNQSIVTRCYRSSISFDSRRPWHSKNLSEIDSPDDNARIGATNPWSLGTLEMVCCARCFTSTSRPPKAPGITPPCAQLEADSIWQWKNP